MLEVKDGKALPLDKERTVLPGRKYGTDIGRYGQRTWYGEKTNRPGSSTRPSRALPGSARLSSTGQHGGFTSRLLFTMGLPGPLATIQVLPPGPFPHFESSPSKTTFFEGWEGEHLPPQFPSNTLRKGEKRKRKSYFVLQDKRL